MKDRKRMNLIAVQKIKTSGLILLVLLFSIGVFAQQRKEVTLKYQNIGTRQGLPSSETYLVHQDREGYMWFCTDRGVVRYDGFRLEGFNTSNGLTDNVVFRIFEDWKGRIWFLSLNDKLAYYENDRIVVYKYNNVLKKNNHSIGNYKTMYVDRSDNLYYGTHSSGILKIDRNGKCTVSKYATEHLTLDLRGERGQVLTAGGITREKTDSIGILCVRRNGKPFKRFKCFYFQYYAGLKRTRSMDVVRLDHTFFNLNKQEDFLIVRNNTGIFEAGGDLWITTGNGALHFPDLRNGLKNASGYLFLKGTMVSSVFKDRNQGLWFSSLDNGIYYSPDHAFIDKQRKQLTLKRIRVNDSVVSFKNQKSIALDADAKFITLELRTTDYTQMGNQRYRFRLSNNAPWSYGYSGKLTFYDLKPGDYHLEVSYPDHKGQWQKPYEILELNKAPEFTGTIWFYLILIAGGLLVSFVFVRTRNTRLNKQLDLKREIEKVEQQALLSQMNPHFIFNALNSIQSFLIYRENEHANRYLLKLSELIRMTLTNSQKSEIPVREELSALRKYLELETMRFKNRFQFTIEARISDQELACRIPPMLIQPFVENSILHGFKGLKEGGEIQVIFSKIENEVLQVEVRDNGVGYQDGAKSSDNGHKSYGTKITSERLNLYHRKYGGDFSYSIQKITDDAGNSQGTVVRISIPVIN